MYELLGDVTANKCVVSYLKQRFPFLNSSKDVKCMARLRINLVSKNTFSEWGKRLHLIDYISIDMKQEKKQHISILEDVFEALIGCIEATVDHYVGGYTGMYYCLKFIESMMKDETINLSYNNLFDSITRLKETFDFYNSKSMVNVCPYIFPNSSISFHHEKVNNPSSPTKDLLSNDNNTLTSIENAINDSIPNDEEQYKMTRNQPQYYLVKLLQTSPHKKTVLLEEKGTSINDIKIKLSENYLQFLKEQGFEKPIDPYYEEIQKQMIKNEMEQINIDTFV